jgi:hypothetical protein
MDNREYLNYENIDIPELTDYRGTLKEFATIVLALMKEYGPNANISIHPTIDETAEVSIRIDKRLKR